MHGDTFSNPIFQLLRGMCPVDSIDGRPYLSAWSPGSQNFTFQCNTLFQDQCLRFLSCFYQRLLTKWLHLESNLHTFSTHEGVGHIPPQTPPTLVVNLAISGTFRPTLLPPPPDFYIRAKIVGKFCQLIHPPSKML